MRMRLTMKPGRWRVAITCLPIAAAQARTAASVPSLVSAPRTSSTSGMTGTGLKKCMPTTRDRRSGETAAASRVMLMELVFEARTASDGARRSRSASSVRLTASSSKTASTTRAAPLAARTRPAGPRFRPQGGLGETRPDPLAEDAVELGAGPDQARGVDLAVVGRGATGRLAPIERPQQLGHALAAEGGREQDVRALGARASRLGRHPIVLPAHGQHRPPLGSRAVCPRPGALVDDDEVGHLEEPRFDGLYLVPHLGRLHHDRRVGDGGHLDLGLAGAHGLDEAQREAHGVEDGRRGHGRRGQPSRVAARGHGADEDVAVAGVCLHAHAVTEDGAAGGGARRRPPFPRPGAFGEVPTALGGLAARRLAHTPGHALARERTLARMNSATRAIVVPGPKTAAMPAALGAAMSSSGMMPPAVTSTPSRPSALRPAV